MSRKGKPWINSTQNRDGSVTWVVFGPTGKIVSIVGSEKEAKSKLDELLRRKGGR